MPPCFGCCSLRCVSIVIVMVAIFVKIINPLLDDWIAPLDIVEHVEVNNKTEQPSFDPDQTDILGLQLGYVKPSIVKDPPLNLGLTFMLRQSFPRWIISLMDRREQELEKDNPNYVPMNETYTSETVNILDARKIDAFNKNKVSSFHATGFTLLDMKESASLFQSIKSWRGTTFIKPFQEEVERQIRTLLYPNATRIVYTYNVVRGGSNFGDQPAAIGGLHLDYTQKDADRRAFHEEYPPNPLSVEQSMLLGLEDTGEDEFRVLLGIWKPIEMSTPVCDHPLAVMDGSTFREEHSTSKEIHINFGFFTFHNLNGGIRYHPDQQLYYYSFQEDHEVLVFTQYTRRNDDATGNESSSSSSVGDNNSPPIGRRRFLCNPHTSFVNPTCPHDEYDSRVSVEMRAGVFFKKEH